MILNTVIQGSGDTGEKGFSFIAEGSGNSTLVVTGSQDVINAAYNYYLQGDACIIISIYDLPSINISPILSLVIDPLKTGRQKMIVYDTDLGIASSSFELSKVSVYASGSEIQISVGSSDVFSSGDEYAVAFVPSPNKI